MQVKYNKKASQHISSTIDYYLENVRGKTLRVAAFWDMRMRPDKLTKMV